jgi:tetratricopeptide (TPR) repeat protein
MTSGGVCKHCGYALRPLEEQCPRCSRGPAPAPPPPTDRASERPEVEQPLPPAAPGTPCCSIWGILGALLVLVIVAGALTLVWMQPEQRARREYRAGLRAQLANDFEKARTHYREALRLDPRMGLAAFSIGTTHLRFGDPAMTVAIQQLMDRAVWGQTKDLDEADRWFREAIRIGQELPPGTRLIDERINTPPRLRAFAHVCLALTAYLRANAALLADQFDDGMSWYRVAQTELAGAMSDDPGNEAAQRMLREPGPTAP